MHRLVFSAFFAGAFSVLSLQTAAPKKDILGSAMRSFTAVFTINCFKKTEALAAITPIVVQLKVVWLATTTKSNWTGDGCQSVRTKSSTRWRPTVALMYALRIR